MKIRFGLFLLVIVLLSVGLVSGQAVFTDFTADGVAKTTYLDWGKFQCPGGELAGPWPPQPPCSEGSRVNVRDMKYVNKIAATDDRMSGELQVVFNANTDGFSSLGPGSGPLWGTSRLTVMTGNYPDWTPTGEVWEGNWTGKRDVSTGVAISEVKIVLHGNGGRIEGMKAELYIYTNHNSPAEMHGRILEPGGK